MVRETVDFEYVLYNDPKIFDIPDLVILSGAKELVFSETWTFDYECNYLYRQITKS